MMNTPTTLTKKDHQAAIAWYHSIVTYLLNRADGLPLSVTELIRERNHENLLKFGANSKAH